MTPKPLTLEPLSPAQLAHQRLLGSRQRQFVTQINQSETIVTLNHQPSDALPVNTLLLELNGQPYSIYVGDDFLDALLPGKMDHHGLKELPNDLMMAVLSQALNSVLQQLGEQLGFSCTVQGLNTTESSSQSSTLGVEIEQKNLRTRIELPVNDWLTSLLNSIPAHHPSHFPDIPFWATLESGHTQLMTSVLNSLAVGDVVFLDQCVQAPQVIVRLSANTAFLGEHNDSGIRIVKRYQVMDDDIEEQAVTEEPAEIEAEDTDISVDLQELPVKLTFDVGQKELSLAELQSLQAGFVFELDRSTEKPVTIRANGKVIGQCELVQIDSRIGARITDLNQ